MNQLTIQIISKTSIKINKLQKLLKTGVMDAELLKYLPAILPLAYQKTIYIVRINDGWFNIQRSSNFRI